MNPILTGLLLYLLLVLVIGFITYRFMGSMDDFLLGGKRLGAWVLAISERASGESAWFLLGLPGLAFATGMSAYWTVIGCGIGIFLSWTLIARKLREKTGEYGALTIPDYLEERFRDGTHILRIVSTVIILVFYTVYVGAQFIGAGKVLNVTFGLNPLYGMMIGAGIVMFYTLMGGFLAVVWTDLIQGLLMVVVSIVLPIVGIIKMGGFGAFVEGLGKVNPEFLSIGGGKTGQALILGLAIGSLGIGLGYMGQPHLLVRYMAIKNPKDVRQGVLVAMIWVLLAYWGAALIGLVGVSYLGPSIVADSEQIMPKLAQTLFPGLIAGLAISGAIAAMMSTADSQLLVATSAVVEDIYRRLLKRDAEEAKLVVYSRLFTILIAVVAFILAVSAKQLIFWLVLYAWAGLGASFGPPLLLSLWWKGTTRWGALAGLIVGTLTVLIWYNVPSLKGIVYELVPAFTLSLIAVIVVSLLTKEERGQ
jgi:sodium/proline symporter